MLVGAFRKSVFAQRRLPLSLVTGVKYFSLKLPLPTCVLYGGKEDVKRIQQLEAKVEEARQTPTRWRRRKNHPRVERMDSEGNFLCYTCKTFQGRTSFYADWRRKYGLRSQCKACYLELTHQYQALTLRGIFNKALREARERAVRRSRMPSRKQAGQFELDLNLLLNLWLTQQGRCFYSGLVMSVESHTSWRFSIERRDNHLGYIPSNVVLICSEFNTSDSSIHAKYDVFGSSQWSQKKVQVLPRLISASNPVGDDEIRNNLLADSVSRSRKRSPKREATPNGNLFCGKCCQYKSPVEFPRNLNRLLGRNSICKICHSQYRHSFLGFFRSKLSSAKYNAQARIDKGRKEAGVFELSLESITTLYECQRGLCFYSGVRLSLKPLSDWMCSIERLDNTRGYTVDNTVLICSEFQSSDRSLYAKRLVKGTSQWSREKVQTG